MEVGDEEDTGTVGVVDSTGGEDLARRTRGVGVRCMSAGCAANDAARGGGTIRRNEDMWE